MTTHLKIFLVPIYLSRKTVFLHMQIDFLDSPDILAYLSNWIWILFFQMKRGTELCTTQHTILHQPFVKSLSSQKRFSLKASQSPLTTALCAVKQRPFFTSNSCAVLYGGVSSANLVTDGQDICISNFEFITYLDNLLCLKVVITRQQKVALKQVPKYVKGRVVKP